MEDPAAAGAPGRGFIPGDLTWLFWTKLCEKLSLLACLLLVLDLSSTTANRVTRVNLELPWCYRASDDLVQSTSVLR